MVVVVIVTTLDWNGQGAAPGKNLPALDCFEQVGLGSSSSSGSSSGSSNEESWNGQSIVNSQIRLQ